LIYTTGVETGKETDDADDVVQLAMTVVPGMRSLELRRVHRDASRSKGGSC
jgi:hypothetical protein